MISLTYLKLIISGADKLPLSDWVHLINTKVVPALEAADTNGDGSLSLKELLALVKKLIVSSLL